MENFLLSQVQFRWHQMLEKSLWTPLTSSEMTFSNILKCFVQNTHINFLTESQIIMHLSWEFTLCPWSSQCIICLLVSIPRAKTQGSSNTGWEGSMCHHFPTLVHTVLGSWDSLLVKAPDSWPKGSEFKSWQKRQENFLLLSQLCVLTLIQCPFHPHVTTVAHKRPRSFCQKRRW